MPSPIAHCALALLAAPLLRRGGVRHLPRGRKLVLVAAVLLALCAPDVDFLLRALSPGNPLTAHGGFTHSLAAAGLFAVPFAVGCWLLVQRRLSLARLWAVGFLCYGSHILLDTCSTGRGVMALWPLSEERVRLPYPLFYGARHDQPWAWHLHLITLANELGFLLLVWLVARRRAWRWGGATEVKVKTDG